MRRCAASLAYQSYLTKPVARTELRAAIVAALGLSANTHGDVQRNGAREQPALAHRFPLTDSADRG